MSEHFAGGDGVASAAISTSTNVTLDPGEFITAFASSVASDGAATTVGDGVVVTAVVACAAVGVAATAFASGVAGIASSIRRFDYASSGHPYFLDCTAHSELSLVSCRLSWELSDGFYRGHAV